MDFEKFIRIMHPKDNVAVCIQQLEAGTQIDIIHKDRPVQIKIETSIPLGHKIALEPIGSGEPIFKYGEVIGKATQPIKAGQHVHVHNVTD